MGNIGSGTGSTFPATLDTQNTPEQNGVTVARSAVPNDLASAIIAIETFLGTQSSLLGGFVDARQYVSINAAVADGAGKTVLVAGQTSLAAALTVPANVGLLITNGGGLTSNGFTATINGPFSAGLNKIFSGFSAGDVTFGAGSVKEVYPDWWGNNTIPGTTDMTIPIKSSYSSGAPIVKIGASTYTFFQQLMPPTSVIISGSGVNLSILKAVGLGVPSIIAGTKGKYENLQITGSGTTSDGVQITNPNVVLDTVWVNGFGRDGIRIGSDAGGDNANSWNLNNCVSSNNVRRGVYINDDSSSVSVNANAGTATHLQVYSNGEDGLRSDNAFLNTFIGTLAFGNTGWGINQSPLQDFLQYNNYVGGDLESNEAGNFKFGIHARANNIYGLQILGFASGLYSDLGVGNFRFGYPGDQRDFYTPTVVGSISAGTATYYQQIGRISVHDKLVTLIIGLNWTGHTGTGDMQVSLPAAFPASSVGISSIGTMLTTSIPSTAGALLAPYTIPGQSNIQLGAVVNGGPINRIQMSAAGALNVQITYEY